MPMLPITTAAAASMCCHSPNGSLAAAKAMVARKLLSPHSAANTRLNVLAISVAAAAPAPLLLISVTLSSASSFSSAARASAVAASCRCHTKHMLRLVFAYFSRLYPQDWDSILRSGVVPAAPAVVASCSTQETRHIALRGLTTACSTHTVVII